MHPLIGITVGEAFTEHGQPVSRLTHAYSDAVLEAGGLPVLVPSAAGGGKRIAEWGFRLDGLIMSGGGDIALSLSRGAAHVRVGRPDVARDDLEFALLDEFLRRDKPVLGICRGCQVLNTGLGGTLYTHLPDQLRGALDHEYPGDLRTTIAHSVQIRGNGRLARLVRQPAIEVNSHHHQGIRDLGKGLEVVALSSDGLVEAVELSGKRFVIGVQWHPEWLKFQEWTRRLFAGFVEACASS